MRVLDKSWIGFFKAIKSWAGSKEAFTGIPKPPKYGKKGGEHLLIFTNRKIVNGVIKFPKKLQGFTLKTRLPDETKINQIRIIPQGVGYKAEIIYEVEKKDLKLNTNNVIGIDLGIVNTATIVDNIGNNPIIIKGGPLKSSNQFYNKSKAKLQQLYRDIKLGEKFYGKKLKKLDHKRNNIINDLMHKYSRAVINYCIKNNVGRIVVGHNKDWQRGSNLGKQFNQKFVQIPFSQLIQKISYKAEEVGIEVIETEESYTSKCSFLDFEPLAHKNKGEYLGKRGPRGLFTSSKGIKINSDVNGAYNILRKGIPNLFKEGIEGLGFGPVSLNLSNLKELTGPTTKQNLSKSANNV